MKQEKKSRLASLPPILSSAFSTAALMFPVDVVRAIRMGANPSAPTTQLLTQFTQKYGVTGFFTQGLVPEVARASWMRALKFFFFPVTHEALWNKPTSQGSPFEKAVAGALCTVPEAMTILPMELAKVGLQLDQTNRFRNSSSSVLGALFSTYGWRGLWIGYPGIQLRQSAWTSIYFGTLSTFEGLTKDVFAAVVPSGSSTAWVASSCKFLSGFFAGVTGAVLNVPFDLIRTRIQRDALEVFHSGGQAGRPPIPFLAFPQVFSAGSELVAQRGLMALQTGFFWKAFHLGGSGALMAGFLPVFTKIFDGR